MAQEVLRGWLLRATFRGTPKTQAVDSRVGLLVPATPASERLGVSCAQQLEQSKEVFCPVPAKNTRRPTNSSDCRFIGGNPLKRAPRTIPFQNQRQGWLEETQTWTHPVCATEEGTTTHTDCRSQGHSESGFCRVCRYRRNRRGDVHIRLMWPWDA